MNLRLLRQLLATFSNSLSLFPKSEMKAEMRKRRKLKITKSIKETFVCTFDAADQARTSKPDGSARQIDSTIHYNKRLIL